MLGFTRTCPPACTAQQRSLEWRRPTGSTHQRECSHPMASQHAGEGTGSRFRVWRHIRRKQAHRIAVNHRLSASGAGVDLCVCAGRMCIFQPYRPPGRRGARVGGREEGICRLHRAGRQQERCVRRRPLPADRLCMEDVVPVGPAIHGVLPWAHDDAAAPCTACQPLSIPKLLCIIRGLGL